MVNMYSHWRTDKLKGELQAVNKMLKEDTETLKNKKTYNGKRLGKNDQGLYRLEIGRLTSAKDGIESVLKRRKK